MDPTVLDTDPEVARRQREVWRRMGPERRSALGFQMSDDVRAIAIEGELQRHPEITPREAMIRVARRLYGDALIDAAYGPERTRGRR